MRPLATGRPARTTPHSPRAHDPVDAATHTQAPRNRLTEPEPKHKSNPSHTPKPLTLDSYPSPPREQHNHSPHPQPTQPPNQPAPETKRHLTKPTLAHTRVHQDARAAPLGRDRRHSTDDTRQTTQRYCTAAPAARACACTVRAPLFFSFWFFFLFFSQKKKKKTSEKKKNKKKTKIRGGGRGT